jgi:hypothetical protein
MKRIFMKKGSLFTVGSVYRVKRFTIGLRNPLKDEEVETDLRKWLRQLLGFDALVKRWDKCIDVDGGCIRREINVFSRFGYHMFFVLYQFVTYLRTVPRISSL